MPERPIVLVIFDGFGVRAPAPDNAIHLARKPVLDALYAKYPHGTLDSSGHCVGLPAGQMGNSEVGHLNIGAGRVVYQELTRINRAIASGDFFENRALCDAVDAAKERTLHLFGLVSDGCVHASLDHLDALLELARRRGARDVALHAFTDGRDTPPRSGPDFLRTVAAKMKSVGVGRIATVSGRYFAMDRDKRWNRVLRAFNAIAFGRGRAGDSSFAFTEGDEFVEPTVIGAGAPVQDGDSIVFFNFRADRARELTRAFTDAKFNAFPVSGRPANLRFTTMTSYDDSFALPVAFPPQNLSGLLGEVVSDAGLAQFRVAETEKYAHVTYFFNGGREVPYAHEDRVLVPSPRDVATYDLKPEMSADEVTRQLAARISSGRYRLSVVNFANGDMVGHTANVPACVRAVETLDRSLGVVVEAALKAGGAVYLTADHGNIEMNINPETGEPHTAHTINPVPFLAIDPRRLGARIREGGVLADIAPTLLPALELARPPGFEGRSLFEGD
ncbi:MAG: 2,3-bisphosphoglycerate-independent phosphoglycerate mutase [Deltaproteobacteria bacterium]|nr:2,3-bisphosphoglycerate-independent phosphoglycerate mutase [Deltaproteobacteria bacterium]